MQNLTKHIEAEVLSERLKESLNKYMKEQNLDEANKLVCVFEEIAKWLIYHRHGDFKLSAKDGKLGNKIRADSVITIPS